MHASAVAKVTVAIMLVRMVDKLACSLKLPAPPQIAGSVKPLPPPRRGEGTRLDMVDKTTFSERAEAA